MLGQFLPDITKNMKIANNSKIYFFYNAKYLLINLLNHDMFNPDHTSVN